MKKFICTVLFFSVFAIVFAWCGKKTITGHIQIYGNAPFTFVGFITDNGEEYSLDIDPKANFTIRDINEKQGKVLKLTGIINDKELMGFQTLKNGRFMVIKFKTIESTNVE